MDKDKDDQVSNLLNTPDLAAALESSSFKQFLDEMPIAIAVASLKPHEHIVYSNKELERVTGLTQDALQGKTWQVFADAIDVDGTRLLSDTITETQDYAGTFTVGPAGSAEIVDAWTNIIEDDAGIKVFRLVALARIGAQAVTLAQSIQDKDTQLRELQHRVKNNLQMITALIRLEARNLPADGGDKGFDRLAGRIEALALLYRAMSVEGKEDSIDLGTYLSEIASAVMRAHAVEGIRLDLKVDSWPVSVNVAMPTGLVVNELLTNALKHAFKERDGGTITLHCLVSDRGFSVTIADDGVGLPAGTQWPKPGRLGATIVDSLSKNARAQIDVTSEPGRGTRVSIFFSRADAA